jgi:4'-phosphopantetheinyl transferase EntD
MSPASALRSAPLLRGLLPPGVALAELRDVPALGGSSCYGEAGSARHGENVLLAAEEAALGRVGAARWKDFSAGRLCARRALAQLGAPPRPLLRGPEREPLWPAGFVGSITHCTGFAAAAVARAGEWAAVGVDAEPHAPLPRRVRERITVPGERRWLCRPPTGAVHWDRLVFSAKEAVYKAWYPVQRTWLGFGDAQVTVEHLSDDGVSGSFRAVLSVAPVEYLVRFAVRDGYAVTATTQEVR